LEDLSRLAAEADHRAAALVGEGDPDRAVMAEALDDDPAMAGADDFGAANAHVAGLLHGPVRVAEAAVTAPATIPAAAAVIAPAPVPAATAVMVADDEGAAGSTDRELKSDAAGGGGGGGCGDAGGGDNEGGECIADEGFHGVSPGSAAVAP